MYEYSTGLLLMQLYAALLKVSSEQLCCLEQHLLVQIAVFLNCHQTRVAMHGNGTGILFHTNTRPVLAV